MRNLTILFLFFISFQCFSQEKINSKRKLRFPVWTTHSRNSDIIGLSLALFPKDVFMNDTTLTRTYGLRLEPSIFAVFSPLMGRSPVSGNLKDYRLNQNMDCTEIIYGVNLSSGTFGSTRINGISGGVVIQYLQGMNGVSVVGAGNFIEKHNGISFAGVLIETYNSNGISGALFNLTHRFNGIQIGGLNITNEKGTGIQVGLFNKAKNFRGLQIGLWNKNDKRSFPIINW